MGNLRVRIKVLRARLPGHQGKTRGETIVALRDLSVTNPRITEWSNPQACRRTALSELRQQAS